ncbi:MAG: phosphoenolpyruvate carboxykinase (ATP) [Ignavibacteriae bacterium]|nr:phosphoenolpyruvate carboxykinase (ATP) [Ignavibacteriota bacterium]
MAKDIFDVPYYDKFYEELQDALKGPNIREVDIKWLEPRAREFAQKTANGSHVWHSVQSSRLAGKTVYLGTERVRLPITTPEQDKIIKNAPEELKKVLVWLRTLPFVKLTRQMGDNPDFNPTCTIYTCVKDPRNIRLPYMWGSLLFDPAGRPGPNITMIHIPEEHTSRQQILTMPEYNLNICLGSDYLGEEKKGFLRQAMWLADEKGMLGLHAGSKVVVARDARTNELKKYGVILFGMTATGKSTWSCHQLGMDHKRGEMTYVSQDDICFLKDDGSAYGSEANYYVKTDIVKDQQEAMWHSLVDKSALLENVMVTADGAIQWLDESMCGNGRAVIRKDKLAVERDGKLLSIMAKTINLPPLDETDGLIFAFITRRNTIMPFAQKLTPEQGALAYLFGESTLSFAANPLKAGESVRIVGTDDFIIGSRARKVNRFYDIAMKLSTRYPGKVHFMIYNTGGMGEIIETHEENGKTVKKLIRKTDRVPLDLMAAIQRGDLRGTNKYEKGLLGTLEIVEADGRSLDEWNPRKLYTPEQLDYYVKDLIQGRRAFLEEVAREGLRPEIIAAAERGFRAMGEKKAPSVAVGAGFSTAPAPADPRIIVKSDEPVARPRKPGVWRWR